MPETKAPNKFEHEIKARNRTDSVLNLLFSHLKKRAVPEIKQARERNGPMYALIFRPHNDTLLATSRSVLCVSVNYALES